VPVVDNYVDGVQDGPATAIAQFSTGTSHAIVGVARGI
jgi:hypothetical protein